MVTSMTRIADAQAVIQAEAEKLTAKFHAKGYTTTTAEIWIGRGGSNRAVIMIDKEPSRWTYIHHSADLFVMLLQAHEQLAALPHKDAEAMAASAWFDLSHPMNQPLAEVAE